MSETEYAVGIDLGTTNVLVAYTKLKEKPDIKLFHIEQLTGPGEIKALPELPSARYHALDGELSQQDCQLPWTQSRVEGEPPGAVSGRFALHLGSQVEGRLVVSAKSWLCHDKVDRSAPILPWGAPESVPKISPVSASASYLQHVRCAWNHRFPKTPLEQQEIIITIPASFDDIARIYTLQAARLAGLSKVTLLEEPQAAFYHWYWNHLEGLSRRLQNIETLLVCDMGGGTTDFSLIRAGQDGTLERIAVGEHLMLGGDNIDLAIARYVEHKFKEQGLVKRLSASALSQLVFQSRQAKETLLQANAPDSAKVSLLGTGSKLVRQAIHYDLTQAEINTLVLQGFFPPMHSESEPKASVAAIAEFGLPYVREPEVTRHMARFLQAHLNGKSPDAVLLNGGLFLSPVIRQHLLRQLGPVTVLENDHPGYAVAMGAVAYTLAARGYFQKVSAGLSKSYYLLPEVPDNQPKAVCILPRGVQEGERIEIREPEFLLKSGQTVRFNLVASAQASAPQPGDVVVLEQLDYKSLPPLITQVTGEGDYKVHLETQATNFGALQLSCVSDIDGQTRWEFEFDLKQSDSQHSITTSINPLLTQAKHLIEPVFGRKDKKTDFKEVKQLRAKLEKLLGKREDWPLEILRALSDEWIALSKSRRRSEMHERLWLNLAGFCLRPGLGYPGDDQRMLALKDLYQQGLQYAKDKQSWTDWWTFWRRVSGGLDASKQKQLLNQLIVYIEPGALKNRKIQKDSQEKSYEDIVRLIGSLERLAVADKITTGEYLMRRLESHREPDAAWWALGRIGARHPVYVGQECIIPAGTIETWLDWLLSQDWKKHHAAGLSAVFMSRRLNNRDYDVEDTLRNAVKEKLKEARLPQPWINALDQVEALEEKEQKSFYGDTLPAGLKLLVADTK